MEKEYNANDLYIGRLYYVSEEQISMGVRECHVTELKYIFKKVLETSKGSIFKSNRDVTKYKYREIFTKYDFELEENQHEKNCHYMAFDYPYIVGLEPFTEYFPSEKDKQVSELSLLFKINEINFGKEFKRKKDPVLVK